MTIVKTTYSFFGLNVNTHTHSKETKIWCGDWPPRHRSHSPGCPPGPGGWGWGWAGGLWGHTGSTPAWIGACSPGGSRGSGPSPTEDGWHSRRPGGLDRDWKGGGSERYITLKRRRVCGNWQDQPTVEYYYRYVNVTHDKSTSFSPSKNLCQHPGQTNLTYLLFFRALHLAASML